MSADVVIMCIYITSSIGITFFSKDNVSLMLWSESGRGQYVFIFFFKCKLLLLLISNSNIPSIINVLWTKNINVNAVAMIVYPLFFWSNASIFPLHRY